MSIQIRIEVCDDEGIFGSERLSKEKLAELLIGALRTAGAADVDGPFVSGVVQAFTVIVEDPRRRWNAARPPSLDSTSVRD